MENQKVNSYYFDGTNDWYQIAGTSTGYNSFDFNGTGTAQFTVAAWVNQDSTSPTTQTIFGNMDGDSPYHGYTLKTEHGRTYFHAFCLPCDNPKKVFFGQKNF